MKLLQRRRQASREPAKFMSNVCPQCGVRNFRIHYRSFRTTQYRRCKRCHYEYVGGPGIGDAIVTLFFGTLFAGIGALLIGNAPWRVVLLAWATSLPFLLAGVIALLHQFRPAAAMSGGFEVITGAPVPPNRPVAESSAIVQIVPNKNAAGPSEQSVE